MLFVECKGSPYEVRMCDVTIKHGPVRHTEHLCTIDRVPAWPGGQDSDRPLHRLLRQTLPKELQNRMAASPRTRVQLRATSQVQVASIP